MVQKAQLFVFCLRKKLCFGDATAVLQFLSVCSAASARYPKKEDLAGVSLVRNNSVRGRMIFLNIVMRKFLVSSLAVVAMAAGVLSLYSAKIWELNYTSL